MSKYNRENIYKYAQKWALSRNPKYYNYEYIGGDCTNFVSQCIYAGCGQMNYNRLNGWYSINANNKSPSWTGVEFLYDFLISNKEAGPKGEVASIDKLEIGDIIQLSFDGIRFPMDLDSQKPKRELWQPYFLLQLVQILHILKVEHIDHSHIDVQR